MAGAYDILKGTFLTSDNALRNWRFIIFSTLLALGMIYTSHSLERKTHHIAKLSGEVKELRSEYVDGQRQLMHLQMESTIAKKLIKRGVVPAKNPPQKIVVNAE
jgi:hypothetical protein